MKNRTILFSVLSLVGSLTGYFVLQLDLNAGPTGDFLVRFGKAFFYGMGAFAIIFLVLLFVPKAVPSWKKFAKWFIPLAALIFIFYPDPGSGDYFSPYPEQVFQWISIAYVVISLLIIGKTLLKNRNTHQIL